jgi:hypothetical protein
MILNLFKFEGEFGVEDMMKRSFAESLHQKLAMEHRERLRLVQTFIYFDILSLSLSLLTQLLHFSPNQVYLDKNCVFFVISQDATQSGSFIFIDH